LGYLDDVIILPLGILLAVRLMPAEILDECRLRVTEWEKSHSPRPVNRVVAVLIVMIWLAALVGAWTIFSNATLGAESS
jgi:hypothetical protein